MVSPVAPVVDVTVNWPLFGAGLEGEWPFHTRYWGQTVAKTFGGKFRMLRIGGKRPLFLPVLVGGSLAGDGFSSGAVGYGGALAQPPGPAVAFGEHLAAVRAAERYLRRPCRRLVMAPSDPSRKDDAPPTTELRPTRLVPLRDTEEAQMASYSRSLPRYIRKSRRSGVQVCSVAADEAANALDLVHRTQAEVGATYRMPRPLMDAVIGAGTEFGHVLGCRLEGQLIATGVFLRTAGRATHLAAGWSRDYADLRANYALMHHAIRSFADLGDTTLDLGFSHQPGIVEFKRKWGGSEATTWALDSPTAALPVPSELS